MRRVKSLQYTLVLFVILLMTNGFAILPVSAVYVQHPTQNDTAEIGTSSLSRIDRSISWEMVTDPRVEAAVLAQDKKPPQNIPDAPKLFWDDDLGHCYIATNIPRELLQTIGISLEGSSIEEQIPSAPRFEDVYDKIQRIQSIVGANYQRALLYDPVVVIWVKVPATWSTGENIEIKFKMFNEGHQTATVSCHFYGYDNITIPETEEFSVSGSVNINRQSYGYKTLTVEIPDESVGLKRGLATATGDASFSEDMGYSFVQKCGALDTGSLPENDRMSFTSGNNNYYWEGLPDIDGYNISPEYERYHPYAWNITWLAGCLIDSYEAETIDQIAHNMTYATNQKMLYNDSYDDYLYSDFYIMNEEYVGVCAEFACLEVSLLRTLGIPTRQISGSKPTGPGHSWIEYWGQENGGWSWIHADPTLNKYNYPQSIENLAYTEFRYISKWDDSRDGGDGSDTDGILSGYDNIYGVYYDGPNDYRYLFMDICEDASLWTYDGSWPNPIFTLHGGNLDSLDGYLKGYTTYTGGAGPFFYRELATQQYVSDFTEMDIEVSFSNPTENYKGCFGVGLYDENKELICLFRFYEWTNGYIDMDFSVRWFYENGTVSSYDEYNYDSTEYRGMLSIYKDGDYYAYMEGFGYQKIVSESDTQNDARTISYVGIQWRRGSGYFLQCFLHDFRIWEL